MTIVFVGIDLAKNVFALHGVDDAGKARLVRPTVRRAASCWRRLPSCCRAPLAWKRARDLPPTAVPMIRQESWG